MKVVGGFQVVVGTAMLMLWAILLSTGQVAEVTDGRTDIWFHLGAEVVTAALLLAGGTSLLRSRGTPTPFARTLGAVAFGALLYTGVNSAGYYAQLGEWAVVGMFALLTVATIAGIVRLLDDRTPDQYRISSKPTAASQPTR